MKITTLMIVMAALCLKISVKAQDVHPIQIGQNLPENLWNKSFQAINTPTGMPYLQLKDFRGKLIIIDFWATWCTSCIANMPNNHDLQMQFKDELVIIGNTYEPSKKSTDFLAKNKLTSELHALSIVNDEVLKMYFPHRLIPHYVWVDKDGTVIATTEAKTLTSENIKSALEGRTENLTLKADFDTGEPLFYNKNYKIDRIVAYNILSQGYQPGLPSGTKVFERNGVPYRRIFTNNTILGMYRIAARDLFIQNGKKMGRSQFILEVKNRTNLEINNSNFKDKISIEQNTFNFDCIISEKSTVTLPEAVLTSLNQQLGYEAKVEMRKLPCLALRKKAKNSISSGSNLDESYPIDVIAAILNSRSDMGMPVINETGVDKNVKLRKPTATDLEGLKRELSELNLELQPVVRDIEVFVIRDQQNAIEAE